MDLHEAVKSFSESKNFIQNFLDKCESSLIVDAVYYCTDFYRHTLWSDVKGGILYELNNSYFEEVSGNNICYRGTDRYGDEIYFSFPYKYLIDEDFREKAIKNFEYEQEEDRLEIERKEKLLKAEKEKVEKELYLQLKEKYEDN